LNEGKPKTLERATGLAAATFEQQYRELHRFLMRRLPAAQDANDLVQEVFLRILRLEKSELVRKPQAYVYGIASHVAHEFRMRARHERVTYDSQAADQAAEHPRELTPDELADRLGTQRQFEQALALLPPTHQAVLLLHKRDGMSREEVARELGLSVHTVKKYIFQALAQIRADWKP
jgi:RNA polymerase sigma factor (sigma-70 family)